MGFEFIQRADSVGAHEPAVADDISRHNRCEPALD